MGYIVSQYNKSDTTDNSIFMTALGGGKAIRIKEQSDSGVMGSVYMNPFLNEAVYFPKSSLEASKYYYFHGKVKRSNEEQIFYIYLMDKDNTNVDANQQFIKTITVQSGTGWSDIEFMFSPFEAFNTIVFKLQRTAIDYDQDTCRYPTIIYQELSLINSLTTILNIDKFYKIGVQSRPGFLMCINGEEIRIGKTGIYELKNGFVAIEFFSAIAAAKDPEWLEDTLNGLAESTSENINSQCYFDAANADRDISNFSLDYIYEGGVS